MDADVVICGGGLAGLTLARQLRWGEAASRDLRVAVVEPQQRPVPEACHKVGESTVEIGTHYLAEVLGLKDYLTEAHLPKNGLRFFSGPAGAPLSARTELGPSESPIVPSFQLDRGRLENDLRDRLEGAELHEGFSVVDVVLGTADKPHTVVMEHVDGDRRTLTCRWVIDATGRRQLIQRKLGLRRESPNPQSAAWFRLKGHVKVQDLVSASETRWHARDIDGSRWLSTVHLCGRGYWVWIIPLSSGHTSIGVVAEPNAHPLGSFGQPARVREWLRVHEPELATCIGDKPFEDFRILKRYSHLSERCFSTERWACVGEAGVFVDPLYSPGTDFIALANSLATELVLEDHASGANDPERVEMYNAMHLGWCEELNRALSGNTDIFPEPDVLGAKLWCDYYFYWTYQAPFFFRRAFALPAAQLRAFEALRARYSQLNRWAQTLLEAWADLKTVALSPGRPFSPLPMFPSVLADQHLELLEHRTPQETRRRMERDIAGAEGLLVELLILAVRGVGEANVEQLGQRARLGEWDLVVDRDRLDADLLERRHRLKRLPPLARDLERALGRFDGPRQALADSMRRAGINVSTASSGQPGPEWWGEGPPDQPGRAAG